MGGLLLLFPWSLLLLAMAKRYREHRNEQEGARIESAVSRALARTSPVMRALPPGFGDAYQAHLRECADDAAALNQVRPAAINADIQALLHAPKSAVLALERLASPIDTLTVQRDLNFLGAMPPLPETGEMDMQTVEAVRGFQARFGQLPTGDVDPETAVAIRYATGVIHAQNEMAGAP